MQLDEGKFGSSLGSWFALPWNGPEQVILPTFHTPAEAALKRGGNGNEIFLSVCGLMATGARSVLISRWRTAIPTSYHLLREFLQELPHTSAAEAWQRSVRLSMANEIEADSEPRIKRLRPGTTLTSEHPFFWAGYILIDRIGAPPVDAAAAEPAAEEDAADGDAED